LNSKLGQAGAIALTTIVHSYTATYTATHTATLRYQAELLHSYTYSYSYTQECQVLMDYSSMYY